MCGKLWHFDINDGYPLKHDVDIAVGLINPLDWLNLLVLLRSYNYKAPLTWISSRLALSNWGVFSVSFPTGGRFASSRCGRWQARFCHVNSVLLRAER